MRQITKDAVKAFYNWEKFSISNTRVEANWNISYLYLHNNLIAEYNGSELLISSAGWETTTTKERLNWVLEWHAEYKRYTVKQKNYKWYIYDSIYNELLPFNDFETDNIKTFY